MSGPEDPRRPLSDWLSPVRASRPELAVGLLLVAVGVLALVVQDAYRLDQAVLLTGGDYLRDDARRHLLALGFASVVLGIACAVHARSDRRRPATTTGVTAVAALVLLVELGSIVAALAGLADVRG